MKVGDQPGLRSFKSIRLQTRRRNMAGSIRSWCAGYVAALLVLALAGSEAAEVPSRINYQGRLTDAVTGEALVGSHDIVFRLFDAQQSGTEVWSEPATVSCDSAGIFSVILGITDPIDGAFSGPVWLEVEVDGEALVPRREIVSVPFAFHAKDAEKAADSDSLGGRDGDDYLLRDEMGSVTGDMITDGEITDGDIAPDAEIDPAKIAGAAWTSANDGAGTGLDADMVDGLNADAFADTGHTHDDRYCLREELRVTGVVNEPENPVEWTRLKGVPDGFADGTDDVGGAGDGYSLDAADGDPVDVVYVDDDGNVGIGLTTPTLARLEVLGSDVAGVYSTSVDGSGVVGFSQNGNGVLGVSNTGNAGSFVGDVYVSGSLGVGTDPPAAGLEVDGDVNTSSAYKMDGEAVLSRLATWHLSLGYRAGQPALPGSLNTFLGDSTGYNADAVGCTYVGFRAGCGTHVPTQSAYYNTFVGCSAGWMNDDGDYDTFIGVAAGAQNASGQANTFVGSSAGYGSTGGSCNLCAGTDAGRANGMGSGNVCLGFAAGKSNNGGNDNVYVGATAGYLNTAGSNNVFIGYQAGHDELGSNKLYIANGGDVSDVLIYGDFSTGNVGLGTLAPERRLHIKGTNPRILIESTSFGAEVNFKHTGDASSDVWAIYKEGTSEDLRFYQGGDKIWIQGGTGNVGLGGSPGTNRLYVNGNACGTSGWGSCSDLRYKRDIEAVEDALKKVRALRGVSFLWRGDEYGEKNFDSGRHYGVIAQEAEAVLPEVVGEDPDGGKTVAYTEIVPVLIEAIKAQQERIEALEQRLAVLEGR
jgi:hypothetical protein